MVAIACGKRGASVGAMKVRSFLLALAMGAARCVAGGVILATGMWAAQASVATEAERLPIEQRVAEVAKGEKVTVVHFWAPWCANCYGEIAKADGWGKFIAENPNVNVIFVTSWNGGQGDGKA